MAKNRDSDESVHDYGRCIIRKVGEGRFIGLRLPSFTTLHSSQPSHIRQAHDCLEAAERMDRAGLRVALHGKNKTPSGELGKRRTREKHAWERDWLTRAW